MIFLQNAIARFLLWIKDVYNDPETLNLVKAFWGGMVTIAKFVWMFVEMFFWLIQEPIYFLIAGFSFILILSFQARNIVSWGRQIFRNSNRFLEGSLDYSEKMFNVLKGFVDFVKSLIPGL